MTIDHNELWNGNQGIQVNVKRQVTISENHIHTLGSKSSSEDTHGVAICGTGTAASGWSEAISVINNSIHDAGGDAVQEMTDAYCSGTYQFLIIANNNLYNNQEQGFDSKGTQDLRMYGNDIYGNGEGGIIATNDPVGSRRRVGRSTATASTITTTTRSRGRRRATAARGRFTTT